MLYVTVFYAVGASGYNFAAAKLQKINDIRKRNFHFYSKSLGGQSDCPEKEENKSGIKFRGKRHSQAG